MSGPTSRFATSHASPTRHKVIGFGRPDSRASLANGLRKLGTGFHAAHYRAPSDHEQNLARLMAHGRMLDRQGYAADGFSVGSNQSQNSVWGHVPEDGDKRRGNLTLTDLGGGCYSAALMRRAMVAEAYPTLEVKLERTLSVDGEGNPIGVSTCEDVAFERIFLEVSGAAAYVRGIFTAMGLDADAQSYLARYAHAAATFLADLYGVDGTIRITNGETDEAHQERFYTHAPIDTRAMGAMIGQLAHDLGSHADGFEVGYYADGNHEPLERILFNERAGNGHEQSLIILLEVGDQRERLAHERVTRLIGRADSLLVQVSEQNPYRTVIVPMSPR